MVIPDYIVRNNNLSLNAKFLYALILENQNNGVCIENNTFFACRLDKGVTERTVRTYIKELKDNGIIFVGRYKQAKNAIFVINTQDYVQNTVQKITKVDEGQTNVQELEKIFHFAEINGQNTLNSTPNINYTKGLYTLVLVSKENKNNNYISKSARVREEIDNYTIFSNYDRLKESERAPIYDDKSRAHYTNLLFREFFKWNTSGKLHNAGIEIVDTIIEALKQSNSLLGFKYDMVTYDKNNPFSDLVLNLTENEFTSIASSIAFRDDINNRPAYIIGAIVQAGTKINWKKADELVRKGWPWSDWTPTDKTLSNVFFATQHRVEKEKQYLQFKQEFENKNLRRNL